MSRRDKEYAPADDDSKHFDAPPPAKCPRCGNPMSEHSTEALYMCGMT
jgi:hypothetical protein